MKKIKILILNYQLPILYLFLFIFSFFLRVYNLNHYISFHQDQIRDLLIIKRHFEEKTFPFLGPKASVGDFYLPPFWYYLMSVSYIFSPSPLSPAVMVALLNSLTTIFVYFFTIKFFNKRAAIFSSLLYATSSLSIEYSRFAWNPNPVPFFIILTFYFLYQFLFLKKEVEVYFILGALTANLTLQLHYQGVIIFIFYFLINFIYKKINLKRFSVYILINILLTSPFIYYEIKNNFINTYQIINFFISSQTTDLKFFGIPFYLRFLFNDFSSFLSSLIFFKNKILGYLGLFFLLTLLLIFLLNFKKINKKLQIVNLFLLFSILMLYTYKNSLINFYLLFLIPIVIIYFSIVLNKLTKKISLIIFSSLIIINLIKSPVFGSYDNTYLWIQEASLRISQNKNYCVEYDIFKETFIEDKLRYMLSIQKNQPLKKCDRNNLIFYFCEPAKCNLGKFHNKKIVVLNLKEKYYVKIYKIEK